MQSSVAMCALAVFLVSAGEAAAQSGSSLRGFLYSAPNTYGWQPAAGGNSYDFFKDGRLHVQGADGEATMWEGSWKLKGDQLTIKIPALKVNKTVTVSVAGDALVLDGDRYDRIRN